MPITLRKRQRDPRNDPHAPGLELDRELAERIVKGDREALARFVDRHIGAVYKYVARYVGPGHEELISEVVRATFTDALNRMKHYASGRAHAPMRLWLLKRANHHVARRRARLKAPGTDAAADDVAAHDVAAHDVAAESEELAALRKAMSSLPPRYAAALSAALFEELPPEEMAIALGASPARAMRLLRGALRRLDRLTVVEEDT